MKSAVELRFARIDIVADDYPGSVLAYALDDLRKLCECWGISVGEGTGRESGDSLTLLVGRRKSVESAGEELQNVCWENLDWEEYVLRVLPGDKGTRLTAAGNSRHGDRNAFYRLMREMRFDGNGFHLPADLDIQARPRFDLRGMYAHQHWDYEYPYALRTWSIEEWKQYAGILALMGCNLLQIWSVAGLLPVPFSIEDRKWLSRYPEIMDHARRHHGMQVWLGECANNVCESKDPPPIEERYYFDHETLKDPSDTAQMKELAEARSAFYRACPGADGYWVIDSDPGGWPGSPSREFVDILMMNRHQIDEDTHTGPTARLIYWMWFGWGNETRKKNWSNTLADLKLRNPDPWMLTAAHKEHMDVVDELSLRDRTLYYPYGSLEPEPSLPFTRVMPPELHSALTYMEKVRDLPGVMGNAQTPVVQLPNIWLFLRSAWGELGSIEEEMHTLARMVYPEQADVLAKGWLALVDGDSETCSQLAEQLDALVNYDALGVPGPIGRKLFPDYAQVARDLVNLLEICAAGALFCEEIRKGSKEDVMVRRLIDYSTLSLIWRRKTGFRMFGYNGYSFDRVNIEVKRLWWQDDGIDPKVIQAMRSRLSEKFEAWEVELAIQPLGHLPPDE